LLGPHSLRPSGHLRCASSPPPGGSVVAAVDSHAQRGPFFRKRVRPSLRGAPTRRCQGSPGRSLEITHRNRRH
jgi:hypothetical protein